MAEPRRNLLTLDDTFEAAASPKCKGMAGYQVLGAHIGRALRVPYEDLLDIGRNWIFTEVGSGATAGVAQVADDTNCPVAKFTTGASQHNNQQIQWAKALTAGSTTLSAFGGFSTRTGYNIHMHARLEVTSTWANAAFFLGLADVDTTIMASSTYGFTDGVGFFKAAGSANILGVQRASSTNTLTTGAGSGYLEAGVISTWYDLEMLIVPGMSVTYWVNNNKYNETTLTNLPAATVALCPTFVVSAGTAAAATALVQSLVVTQEAV